MAQKLGALTDSMDKLTRLRPTDRLAIASLAIDDTLAHALLKFGKSEVVSTSTSDAGPLIGSGVNGDFTSVHIRRAHVLATSEGLYKGHQGGKPLTVANVLLPSVAVYQPSDASFGNIPELIVGRNNIHDWVADQVIGRTVDEPFALKVGPFLAESE